MDNNGIVKDENLDVKEMIAQRQQEQEQPTYNHGDYVPGRDGEIGGILIDHDEILRKETNNPHIDDIKNKLGEMDNMIASVAHNGTMDFNNEKSSTVEAEQDIVRRANPLSPQMADIQKVSEIFASVEITDKGLRPSNSKEAIEFNQKMEAIKEGKVDLSNFDPTKNPDTIEEVHNEPTPVKESTQSETPTSEEQTDSNVVQFNVDANKADVFLTTLSPEDREKIAKSNTIIVNEIKTLNLPVATRTITSLDEFKRVMPRQSHSGVVETVNVNSGYVATFSGCGSLALATIIPDQSGQVDYAKRYQLCYDNLVTTSLGKLSYTEFCARTHMNDLSNMLFAILRASDPDENMISLECADCGKSYDVKYKLSELLDPDSVTPEMNKRLMEIVSVRDMKEDAMRVHMQSSIMNVKYVEFELENQKIIVEMSAPNGTRTIEVYSKLMEIMKKYTPFVAGMIPYIRKVYVQFTPEGETSASTYEITDIDAICQLIRELNTTCIQAIGKIMEGIDEFNPPTYSFKGKYRCPHCGRIEESVECSVDSLIFYRVEQAIR